MSVSINSSIQYLKNVGPKRAVSFEKIGIKTIKDLLFYFPSKHLDRSNILSVQEILHYLRNGYDGEVTIIGRVTDSELIRYGKKQIFKVTFINKFDTFECVWFQGIKYFKNSFPMNSYFALSGKPVITRYGNLQIAHPDFDRINEKESNDFMNTGKIIPFYSLPKQLKSANLGDFSLRRIINHAVKNFADEIPETLPEYIIKELDLLALPEAVKQYHYPDSIKSLQLAIKRFKFEELLYFELLVALKKYKYKNTIKGISFHTVKEPLKRFLDSLPFELTNAQLKVLREIRLDMEESKPMKRLLQGDVGSGKTIVAIIASIIAISNGYQSVLMAPTEILADQHYRNIKKLLKVLNYETALLIGGQKKSERNKMLEKITSGKANFIVGTHALFEEGVEFNNLGLVIIDEQHRFGVLQRGKLIRKGSMPDVLVMSATPIPRTLTMSLYGDLDVSIIDEMPKNRLPIKTYLRGESKLPDVFGFIKSEIKKGNQAFIVYPLVEESDKLELKAAEEYYKILSENEFKDCSVGLIHGKMNWRDKEEQMFLFAKKEYDILVATTVIEVGIDIPDANIIVINDAFRFGLSQLHQLRGRVGRGNKQAYCILITKDEYAKARLNNNLVLEYLSKQEIEKYKSFIRLKAMVDTNDGFKLSEIDLKLRGPGNIFGKEQSGYPDFKHANIIEDIDIVIRSKDIAFSIIDKDPSLSLSHNKLLKHTLNEKHKNSLFLSTIA